MLQQAAARGEGARDKRRLWTGVRQAVAQSVQAGEAVGVDGGVERLAGAREHQERVLAVLATGQELEDHEKQLERQAVEAGHGGARRRRRGEESGAGELAGRQQLKNEAARQLTAAAAWRAHLQTCMLAFFLLRPLGWRLRRRANRMRATATRAVNRRRIAAPAGAPPYRRA